MPKAKPKPDKLFVYGCWKGHSFKHEGFSKAPVTAMPCPKCGADAQLLSAIDLVPQNPLRQQLRVVNGGQASNPGHP